MRHGFLRMQLNANSVSFGRHESFPLRFGWLAKGLDALAKDPAVFAREDATVTLGVGRNMVSAIRYWLQATGVAGGQRGALRATGVGEVAFGSSGDPYLEDEATVWLLHWLLATNAAGATAIYWFFNHFHKQDIVSAEVAAALGDYAKRHVAAKVAVATCKRDAALLLRMYAPAYASTRLPLEDALDSPLATLGLLERVDARSWRARPTLRDEIPVSIFAFAVAQLFDHMDTRQLAVEQLMYSDRRHCAPGAVFRMTEEGLIRKLEAMCELCADALRIDRTAGVFQLYRLAPLDARTILAAHYAEREHGIDARRTAA